MPPSSKKSARSSPARGARAGAAPGRSNPQPARASQLRAQTRKLLGKHYRAKYGVR